MATTQLTASSMSTRNFSSFEGLRTSLIQFRSKNARIGTPTQRLFPSLVVKAATVVAPKVVSFGCFVSVLSHGLLIISENLHGGNRFVT